MSNKKISVAKVIDEYTIVLNQGYEDGIEMGQRFLIYSIGEEIIDPETKENLGKLEIVRGTGKVTHLQERIATIGSDMKTPPQKTIRKSKPGGLASVARLYSFGSEEIEEYLPPQSVRFEYAEVGDFAKPI